MGQENSPVILPLKMDILVGLSPLKVDTLKTLK